jgi:adenylate cyclase
VAYESQLKSDRAQRHRRLAAAIESRDPVSADEDAALIAEHLEAAGDLHAASDWHMSAGAWATNRYIAAARLSWERARRVADALPVTTRIDFRCVSPRALCCAATRGGASMTTFRRHSSSRPRFAQPEAAALGDAVMLIQARSRSLVELHHLGGEDGA